ncbi:MAG: hypothetical protein ABH821_05345 [archaeon]
MQKKVFLVLLIFLILIVFSFSVNSETITSHQIEITVNEAGNGNVTEKYVFGFSSELDYEEFKLAAEENGPSIRSWQKSFPEIFPHIATYIEIENVTLSFEETDEVFVTLSYNLIPSIAKKTSETTRKIHWDLENDLFSQLITAGAIIVPENTVIRIFLPRNAEVDSETINPTATINDNLIEWHGFIQSNRLTLNYTTLKPISPPVNTGEIIEDILNSQSTYFLLLVAVILVILIGWKRKNLKERIEDYIVEHSDLKQARREEELEVDLD